MHAPFEQVVARYGPLVLRVCRAVLGAGDADDAWSETFLAALRAYPQLSPDTDLEAWLVTVAHRKAIDQYRARVRRPAPTDALPERPATAADVPGERDPEVLDAVAMLPDKQRLAVAYHYLAGLPYAQIATLLGNSEAAARRASADGIRTLRRRLSTAVAVEEA